MLLYTKSSIAYIPVTCRTKILLQLKTGTYFNLPRNEWYCTKEDEDYLCSDLLIYEDRKTHIIHVKMTNDDRRTLIRVWDTLK